MVRMVGRGLVGESCTSFFGRGRGDGGFED